MLAAGTYKAERIYQFAASGRQFCLHSSWGLLQVKGYSPWGAGMRGWQAIHAYRELLLQFEIYLFAFSVAVVTQSAAAVPTSNTSSVPQKLDQYKPSSGTWGRT